MRPRPRARDSRWVWGSASTTSASLFPFQREWRSGLAVRPHLPDTAAARVTAQRGLTASCLRTPELALPLTSVDRACPSRCGVSRAGEGAMGGWFLRPQPPAGPQGDCGWHFSFFLLSQCARARAELLTAQHISPVEKPGPEQKDEDDAYCCSRGARPLARASASSVEIVGCSSRRPRPRR